MEGRKEDSGQTMLLDSDFCELCFLYVGAIMRWLPLLGSKMVAEALFPHFPGLGLENMPLIQQSQ